MHNNQRLAKALKIAKQVAKNGVIRSSKLDRSVREILVNASFLTEVIRGWYLLTNPAGAGTTTLWYSNYWEFIKQYLADRFGDDEYCLSSDSSLDVYASQNVISPQLIVTTKKASNQVIHLPHKTSILLYKDEKAFPKSIFKRDGLNLVPLAEAICRATPSYFHHKSLNAEICLKMIHSTSDISRVLLTLQSAAVASRIAGAYLRMGSEKKAEQILKDMAAIGLNIVPQDPFKENTIYLREVEKLSSPHSGRIQAMWYRMRSEVVKIFPEPPQTVDPKALKVMEQLYNEDAYHSLSIEGYQVTEDLIEKIKRGKWKPDSRIEDDNQRNALAAKGYLAAFKEVTKSVKSALNGENPGVVFSRDLPSWYRELFTPLAQAQLITPSDLAGYRNHQVFIADSRYVPPPKSAVLDCMETLEKLLIEEQHPAVRAILGHFIFVFIHPYTDGNGRIGRFIMNLMLVTGGYHWTVIRTSERAQYMASLEKASTEGKIQDFAKFVASEMKYWKNQTSNRISP